MQLLGFLSGCLGQHIAADYPPIRSVGRQLDAENLQAHKHYKERNIRGFISTKTAPLNSIIEDGVSPRSMHFWAAL